MTKDEIIKLAREAGIDVSLYDMGAASCVFSEGCHGVARDEFQRFARACYEAGRTAERADCAKVCDERAAHCERKAQEAIESGEHDEVSAIRSTAWQISVLAADFRARGKP